MISGPQFPPVNRIQPIDKDPADDQQDGGQKRKALYKGRSWEERDEDLPVQPSIPAEPPPEKTRRPASSGVYANRVLLERARAAFCHLTTLEEKVAQLCFLETEAFYDTPLQHDVELLIQAWQLGGILFKKGDYKRQGYLIEHYQNVSKTRLLIANDFLHGLSFYLQGDSLSFETLSEQRCSDLGKAVMVQNRRLGVHVQLDRERSGQKSSMSEKQAKSFRKGIRDAQGIVGKEKGVEPADFYSHTAKSAMPFLSLAESPSHLPELQMQSTISFKALTYFDSAAQSLTEELLLTAYKNHYDFFLFSGKSIPEAIRMFCKLIRAGKIREEELDRSVMRILVIKALFFK